MSTWICDKCGDVIEKPEDGWVEWKSEIIGNKITAHDIRLVHTRPASPSGSGCQYERSDLSENEIVNDLPLTSFMGEDGLMKLLLFLHDKELPMDEVIEMIKRVHIFGYEHARKHFRLAIEEGVFEPNTPPNFYDTSEIQATIDFIQSQ